MSVQQSSLFPDGSEVRDRVVAALDELRIEEGRARFADARAVAAELAGLDALEEGLDWLERELGGTSPDVETAARAWLALSAARFARTLHRSAADLVDEALARFLLSRGPAREPFVDRDRRVPRGALHLALGRPHTAVEGLLELLPQVRERADLSGWLGDACLRDARAGYAQDAAANYVRALVLDPDAADCGRMAHEGLVECLERLARGGSAARARALWFAEAWIDGLLDVPPENDWIDDARVAALLASTAASTDRDRARRFSLLLYRDRSRRLGTWNESERAEMEALEPESYGRYRATHALRERARTGALRW